MPSPLQKSDSQPFQLVATTMMGLEQVASRELKQLGLDSHSSANETGRIYFQGGWRELIRANLRLRTAGKILIELAQFELDNDFSVLFDAVDSVPWEEWLPVNASIQVDARSINSSITSVPALQKSLKKGIVSRLAKRYKVHKITEDGPSYGVELTLRRNHAVLTLDSTGRGLHRRSYRTMNVPSPLRETLASALVQLSVWHPDRPLIDPFCASGTIPIEAAMLARNIAPGLKRDFAAQFWECSPSSLWAEEREIARSEILPPLKVKIIGSDIDGESLRLARFHAQNAGVADDIIFRQMDFRDLSDPRLYGCVIGNPPYGDRIGEREDFRPLYESIPGVLAKLPTWSHYLITSWNDFESLIGRKADRRRKLYNSRIECTFFQFLGPRPPKGYFQAGEKKEIMPSSESVNIQKIDYSPAFTGLDDRDKRQIEEFGRCLQNRARHLARYPKRGISSYRLYDRDFPEVPLAIDFYEGKWLHLSEYERPDERSAAAHRLWLDAIVSKAGEILHISPENIFLKRRAPQRGKSQYEKLSQSQKYVEVNEGDLTFLCNMTDYLDVGLFLDHRITRSMVMRQAKGTRFLNLFCYTGSFTCAAAAGGAKETVSVDLSSTYLDWARRNMEKNDLLYGVRHQFVRSDVMEFLKSYRGKPFDLCVCDPPTYSNSKKTENDWDVQKRHVELLLLLAPIMTAGSIVYFSNNFRRFHFNEGELQESYTIREISRQTVPEEYRNKKIHRSWLLIRK